MELLPQVAAALRVPLKARAESERFRRLDRCDSYMQSRQYDHLKFDWDGRYWGSSPAPIDVQPGFVIPLASRRPRLRLELARLVVSRFTAMLLGEGRFPEITVPGDPAAQSFVKGICEEGKLELRLREARQLGGGCGTAAMSFGFLRGKPRIEVHWAKHLTPLGWADRAEMRPTAVLKVYSYPQEVVKDGKLVKENLYYVRLWTEQEDRVWDPIPEAMGASPAWASLPSVAVQHGLGFCPVYLCQNFPNPDSEDGLPDADGVFDDFDELDRLTSATSRGTISNVDPTLVIKADPAANTGTVKKGTGTAIFSPGGAEYLTLPGDAVTAALELFREIKGNAMEVAGVVLARPEEMAGQARSAAALRVLYKPMTDRCDELRLQYGDGLLVPLLKGMLEAARVLQGTSQTITLPDGTQVQAPQAVTLEPELRESVSEDGTVTVTEIPREPGTSSRVVLKWPPYFPDTEEDKSKAVDAATKARGVLVSDETATRSVARFFGVVDVRAEVATLREQVEARAAMLPGPEGSLQDDEDQEKPETDDEEESDA